MLNVTTELSREVEDLIYRTIGCCIAVHRALGPGLLETIYERAIAIELNFANIPFETQRRYPVFYRDELLLEQRVDLVVGEQLIVEVKAVDHLPPIWRAQLLSYLRVSAIRAGLLVNFNVPVLQEGLRRVVL